MQKLFYKMSIILNDAPNSYSSLRNLYTEYINRNIDNFRNDYGIQIDVISLIRNSDDFDEFKNSLQDYCNVNSRNDIKKQFFILLNIIAQNSSSYRDFRSMVELYNLKLYKNKLRNEKKEVTLSNLQKEYIKRNDITLNATKNKKLKTKEEWNIFFENKARGPPMHTIFTPVSLNSSAEYNKKISFTNYKALNNTELKSQEKIKRLLH